MPNIVSSPRLFKKKVVLAKLETAYGTDVTPSGAANWIEARNVSLTPMDVEKADRNIDIPSLGSSGSIIVAAWAKLAYDVAMAPSGSAGVAPKWAPLLQACGFAETVTPTTSVTYNLVSADFDSLTSYINMDGTLHKMPGMRGEVKAKMPAKGLPMFSFSFDSVYVQPVSGLPPVISRTGWTIEEGVNSANTGPATINGVDLAFSNLEWALGNKIGRVDLPGPQVEVQITDRSLTGSITVLAPPLADFDPFALARSGATVPVTTTHGSAAGKKLQMDLLVRITGADYDQVEGMLAYKLTLEGPPVLGNDEIALTLL
ncbi:phage tail tube protein [Pseudoduganella sp. RAF53_2]|uniref:phage tail tube protein n=1 Tax=unclassified Pseudoduganella TaxID=2637179 RepID=UPI003F944F1F